MGNGPPILDYAARPRCLRVKMWAKRIALAILVLGCLYAAPTAWLYWGWRQERVVVRAIKRLGGDTESAPMAGPAALGRVIPGRLRWVRERVTAAYLGATPAADTDLEQLTRLGRLRCLDLRRTRITDDGLICLREFRELDTLYLGYLPEDHTAGPYELHQRFLIERGFYNSPITDRGLAHLRSVPTLRRLFLFSTDITDAGLAHLQGSAGLRVLLLETSKTTDAGVAELRRRLPNCRSNCW